MAGSSERESFLSPSEAAELLGVHPRTLSRWEQAGKLHVIRTVGGHRRYRRAEVLSLRRDVEGGLGTQPADPADGSPPPTGDQRSRARRRALEVLHSADVTGADPRTGLGSDADPFTRLLVEGVVQRRDELDELIGRLAERWTLDRMPVVDRNLLRMGAFELLYERTPPGVVIDQAVTLARLLSTERSGRFVNGVLGRLAREHRGSSDGP